MKLLDTATVALLINRTPAMVRLYARTGVLTPVRFGPVGRMGFRVTDVAHLLGVTAADVEATLADALPAARGVG